MRNTELLDTNKKTKQRVVSLTPQMDDDLKALAYLCNKPISQTIIIAIEQFIGLNQYRISEIKNAATRIPKLPTNKSTSYICDDEER